MNLSQDLGQYQSQDLGQYQSQDLGQYQSQDLGQYQSQYLSQYQSLNQYQFAENWQLLLIPMVTVMHITWIATMSGVVLTKPWNPSVSLAVVDTRKSNTFTPVARRLSNAQNSLWIILLLKLAVEAWCILIDKTSSVPTTVSWCSLNWIAKTTNQIIGAIPMNVVKPLARKTSRLSLQTSMMMVEMLELMGRQFFWIDTTSNAQIFTLCRNGKSLGTKREKKSNLTLHVLRASWIQVGMLLL